MKVAIKGNDKTVTALTIESEGKQRVIPVAKKDLVFFTNGQHDAKTRTQGSMTTPAVMNRVSDKRGCFSLWEKLAKLVPYLAIPKIPR